MSEREPSVTKFDPIKALREELAGLASVQVAVRRRANAALEAIGRAEAELNDIGKIEVFVRIAIEERRAKLRQLEEAAEKST
jgi:hypothetical protein